MRRVPKPTPAQMTRLSHAIREAAVTICGDCSIAALALIQAQCSLEAHVLNEHPIDPAELTLFEEAVGRLKATAVRALEKSRVATSLKTNSAGGLC